MHWSRADGSEAEMTPVRTTPTSAQWLPHPRRVLFRLRPFRPRPRYQSADELNSGRDGADAKVMPVMLTTPEACDQWLEGGLKKALELARPLPAIGLKVVAKGNREG